MGPEEVNANSDVRIFSLEKYFGHWDWKLQKKKCFKSLKFKVTLNPTYVQNFLNFTKSCALSCFSKFDNIKKFMVPFLNNKL